MTIIYKENRKMFLDITNERAAASGTDIEPNKVPFGFVAISALQDVFPCK
jgi:hypothetical protein